MALTPVHHHTATIANGAQLSGEVNLRGQAVHGVITPAALTGVALTFEASDTAGGTFVPVHKADGTAYSVTVAASRFTVVDPTVLRGINYLKVKSGSVEGGARTLKLAARPN
jgi:hypothetical protein